MTATVSSPMPAPPLPIIATAAEAFTSIIANPGIVARLIGSWLALNVAAAAVLLSGLVGGSAMFAVPIGVIVLFVLSILSIAVGWHRFLLLGERPPMVYLALNGHVGRYCVGALILVAVSWLIMFMAAFAFAPLLVAAQHSTAAMVFATILGLAAYLAFAIVMSRAALILPARAIGETLIIGHALDMSRGNAVRMGLATFAVSVPAILVTWALGALQSNAASVGALVVAQGVFLVVTLVSIVASVGVFSIIYRFFGRAR